MFALLLTGCASTVTTMSPQLPEKYEHLGNASGRACGALLFGPMTTFSFIPAGLNTRVERAYQHALESVPGSTALIDITMQEQWYWWIIGSTRCITITGEAIR